MKYHVNPNTGRVGQCRAKSAESCEFSKSAGVVVQHYDTQEAAKAAYEKLNENNLVKKPLKKSARITQQDMKVFKKKKESLYKSKRDAEMKHNNLKKDIRDLTTIQAKFGEDVSFNTEAIDQRLKETQSKFNTASRNYDNFMERNSNIQDKLEEEDRKEQIKRRKIHVDSCGSSGSMSC